MNISRDVVLDLLPTYLAGDASPDTRAIVEEFIAKDSEIASMAAENEGCLPLLPEPIPDVEIEVIRRTKRTVRLRSALLAAAIFFTMLPASVRGGDDGVYWLVVERPDLAIISTAIAVLLWVACGVQSRRLRVTGL